MFNFTTVVFDGTSPAFCYSRVHVTAEMKPNIILKQNKYKVHFFSIHLLNIPFKNSVIHQGLRFLFERHSSYTNTNAQVLLHFVVMAHIYQFSCTVVPDIFVQMSNLAAISVFPQPAHFCCVYCPEWNWLFKTSHMQE